MLKRNQVPSEVLEQLTAHDPDFCVYSFDVTDDGQYALILGIGQDPDFPELHVYRAGSNRVTEVDTGGQLIDMPLSKAFWDRDQTSICVMHLYSKDIYQLVLNSDHKVSEIHNVTGYLAQRAEAVEDKVNYVPDEAPQTSDEYEAFFVQFLAELRAGLSWCERFMDDEAKLKQEYRAIQSRAAMLREWRAQHNSEVDVSDIYDRCNAIRTKLGYDAEHHF